MLVVEIVVFGFVLWLGSYLISRNPSDVRLLLAGSGLITYAVALAFGILAAYATETPPTPGLLLWQRFFLLPPAMLWLLLLIHLMRGDESWYSRLQNQKNPLLVVLTATIFFGLGLGFLIIPLALIPRNLVVVGLGIDFLLLGAAVAFLDAFDEGETLLPHLLQSFLRASLTAVILGGQIALVIFLSDDAAFSLLFLLLGVIGAAILLQTFSSRLQSFLDSLIARLSPQKQGEQEIFRQAADSVARSNDGLDLAQMDSGDFTRLTRRALSHMGNLPRLSASPLTRLPVIEDRLRQKGEAQDTLQRAGELRAVLQESIAKLKPAEERSFGVTDVWRHYNALYYPYVVGLKPYSRRVQDIELNPASEQMMEWFQSQVPQRTLYNWQNEAARLVARDLRERSWPSGQGGVS